MKNLATCQWDWWCNHFLDGLVLNFVRFLGPLPLLFHSKNWVHHFHLGENKKLWLFSFRIHKRHGNIHLVLIMCHIFGQNFKQASSKFYFCEQTQRCSPASQNHSYFNFDWHNFDHFPWILLVIAQDRSPVTFFKLLFSASSGTVPKTFY